MTAQCENRTSGRIRASRVGQDQALVGLAELAERRCGLASLTPLQREILSARARGETFRSIAEQPFISKKTAEEHMAVVTAKFADFLRDHSPADLERELGLGPGTFWIHDSRADHRHVLNAGSGQCRARSTIRRS